MLDLAAKKCVACNSKDLRPMTEEAANNLITKVCGSLSYLLCCVNYILGVNSLTIPCCLGGWMEFGA